MRVPSLIVTFAGFLGCSQAIFTCRGPSEVYISEDDPSYFHKCLAPGISIQLKCPPGQYFSRSSKSCATGLIPETKEPGESADHIPTAPTAIPTAATKKPDTVKTSVKPITKRPNTKKPGLPKRTNSGKTTRRMKTTAKPGPKAKKNRRTTTKKST